MASFRIRGGHMKRIHRIESVAGGLVLLALAGRAGSILITSGAPEILSAGVPKETAEVEKLVGSAR